MEKIDGTNGADTGTCGILTEAYIKTLGIKTKSNTKKILQNDMMINKNGLNFIPSDGEFLCKELYEIPNNFNKKYARDAEMQKSLQEDLEKYIALVGKDVMSRKTGENDTRSEGERKALGARIFAEQVEILKKKTESLAPFQKMMFWLGEYWWYYNIDLREKIAIPSPDRDGLGNIVKKYLIPIFPSEIQKEVHNMRVANTAVGFGHFAILFDSSNGGMRRIITDTQLFEMRDVHGYIYLDITPEGKPIARSKTDRYGERAFFDGERLMSHNNFRTCAPKTIIINGGYKVNSTKCTIVNGMLCNLIDTDDKVAYTTGASCFGCDFTVKDALEALKISEESGKQMSVRNNEIFLGNEKIKPIGFFEKSRIKLQENGFSLYEWSDFYEIDSFKYSDVIAIDDKEDYLKGLKEKFSEIEKFRTKNPSSKYDALQYVLKNNPQVALLDMHLTPDESFEGLWIANHLVANGYKGKIMIISGYPNEQLQAMRKLIKTEGVHIPGKDMNKIRECLTGKCKC